MKETFIELLCAPLTHGALRLANAAELSQINSQIGQRLVRNRDGATLEAELDGALLCQSEKSCYPVRDTLPVLIPGEAFAWPLNS
jgi:uncharacterized protein YbaR (Trm112 family)